MTVSSMVKYLSSWMPFGDNSVPVWYNSLFDYCSKNILVPFWPLLCHFLVFWPILIFGIWCHLAQFLPFWSFFELNPQFPFFLILWSHFWPLVSFYLFGPNLRHCVFQSRPACLRSDPWPSANSGTAMGWSPGCFRLRRAMEVWIRKWSSTWTKWDGTFWETWKTLAIPLASSISAQ